MAVPIKLSSLSSDAVKLGRPRKLFQEMSDRLKSQKTKLLPSKYSPKKLSYAAQMSLRSYGHVESAKIIKDITMTTPTHTSKYAMGYQKLGTSQSEEISETEALSMFIEANLTREQYSNIREKDVKGLPSYKKIIAVKRNCYPEKEAVIVTETSAEVKLQPLLDHTVSRILQAQGSILANYGKLCLIIKYHSKILILQTIPSGHIINAEKFKIFTLNTAKLFCNKYNGTPCHQPCIKS